MVKTVAPAYASLGMDIIINCSPKAEKVSTWHIVRDGRTETLQTIATKYGVPVTRLIEFNFPGSVNNGRVNPAIANWYLFNYQRFRCRATTRDGMNYMFQGGEKVAIPYLGQVEIGEPEIIRSRNTRFKIRMHANLNASMVAAADFSIFEIWDEKAGLSRSIRTGLVALLPALRRPPGYQRRSRGLGMTLWSPKPSAQTSSPDQPDSRQGVGVQRVRTT